VALNGIGGVLGEFGVGREGEPAFHDGIAEALGGGDHAGIGLWELDRAQALAFELQRLRRGIDPAVAS